MVIRPGQLVIEVLKTFHRGSSGEGATMVTFAPDTGWVKLREKACR